MVKSNALGDLQNSGRGGGGGEAHMTVFPICYVMLQEIFDT